TTPSKTDSARIRITASLAAGDLPVALPADGVGHAGRHTGGVPTDEDDEQALAGDARALADGVDAALGPWVERRVAEVLAAQGRPVDDDTRRAARAAAEQARAEVVPR